MRIRLSAPLLNRHAASGIIHLMRTKAYPAAGGVSAVPAVASFLTAALGLTSGVVLAPSATADVRLPAVFSDHMVLQREMPVRIFGRAQPNEEVNVSLRREDGSTVCSGRAITGQDGRFAVTLDPMPAIADPLTMVVEGANTVTVRDVLVGEVWLAGGQSNMEWRVSATGAQADEARALAGDLADVRVLKVPHAAANRAQGDVSNTRWVVLDPATVPGVTAVGFWFARDLHQALGVPVGVLSVNWGGTRAEPWVDLATLGSHPRYEEIVAEQRKAVEAWASVPQVLRDREWQESWRRFQQDATQWWSTVNAADPGAMERWFAPETHDESFAEEWRAVTLPGAWREDPHLRDWDGSAWYLRRVEIPASWTGKDCFVELGPVDDCDVLYVNGRAVANTVADPGAPRRYRVPGDLVKEGPALLALQVFDLHGEGGLTAGPMRMRGASPPVDAQVDASGARKDAEGNPQPETLELAGTWYVRAGRPAEGAPPPPARPQRDTPPASGMTDPGALYHAMIAPLAGFTLRGVIWYQGESNAFNPVDAEAYRDLLPLLVRSWRAAFEHPGMPFGVVSLAAFHPFQPDQPVVGLWPLVRDAQLAAERAVPNVGVVTTIDVGQADDIHPRDKRTVGERLARWALSTTYEQPGLEWRGPRVARHRVEGSDVILEFDVERPPLAARREHRANAAAGADTAAGGNAGAGVFDADAPPVGGFALAGPDGVFHWARAQVVSPTSVRVHCDQVKRPVEVRYAWQDNPQNADLVDNNGRNGLPAHPFRLQVGG